MDHTYVSGDYSAFADQTYWPTSTPMARDTSHGSEYSSYSGSSNGQYDVALSPTSEGVNSCDFFAVPGTGTYIADGQGYGTNTQVEESDFPFHYYDFITSVDSGQGPYWKLKPNFTPSTNFPATIAVDPAPDVPRSANDSAGRHVCLEPRCNASPFKRKADLQRHYLHKHRDVNQKKPFPCDWKRCQRGKEPFYRLDHCREHYRDYHSEDLFRRGPHKENADWWNSRNVDKRWWRCAKCLSRILIGSEGFKCAKCKTTCEPERRMLRGYE
ncbi:hypothetical protein F5Y05DRAFT_322842 [Hypoxylon sp. FL0543]|nr:hypothetical protein F5Y05DRAFT_322842 [Hypoxylon sp. FL0543]